MNCEVERVLASEQSEDSDQYCYVPSEVSPVKIVYVSYISEFE